MYILYLRYAAYAFIIYGCFIFVPAIARVCRPTQMGFQSVQPYKKD